MSKYGEPLTYHKHGEFDAIARVDGLLIATVTDAQLFETDVRRIIACANALTGVAHPERLPGLMEAVRFVLDDVTRQALGDDTLPQVMAAVNDLRRAYAAMMGETP